jgi:cellulose synthase/poly-beta-1,6-N-acetylglucosamine synthase-like glycosyltransferase
MIFIALFVIFGVAYAILIGLLTSGWLKLPVFWHAHPTDVKVSVIVPVKNEERNLARLLDALNLQKYPREYFEVIIVNDHSTDSCNSVVQSKIAGGTFPNLKLIDSASQGVPSGKKHALELGIGQARFNYVVTTDADCILGRHWLQTIGSFIEKEAPDMIIGPVSLIPGNSFFSQMQALEFMSLTGSTVGAAALGKPIMCNGANLVFKKDIFCKVRGYVGNQKIASGDDMFLLHKFKKFEGIKISTMKSHGAMVFAKTEPTLAGFLKQRGRWSGKFHAYNDAFTILSGVLVAGVNLLIAGGLLAGVFSFRFFSAALILLIFKCIMDFPMMWLVTGFLGKRHLLWLYPALSLAYPFYVIAAIAKGLFCKSNWKY